MKQDYSSDDDYEDDESYSDSEEESDDEQNHGQRVPHEVDKRLLHPLMAKIGHRGNKVNNDTMVAREYSVEFSIGRGREQRTLAAAAKLVAKYRKRVLTGQAPDGRVSKKKQKKKKNNSNRQVRFHTNHTFMRI